MHEDTGSMHKPQKPPRERLGAFLKLHREEQGLSQAEMAERLSVDQATISRYETGKPFDGNPAYAYGMGENYFSAPLDPFARRTHFEKMGAIISRHGSADAALKMNKA